ncbi:bifunctional DNA primase/polymerase [Streptomyces sp. WMMB303]|uniref:bifunctional DNA primase/polymerase n=1 Tax=Streptomyces sp. WMMB303 TaxID=3034154 RepID=UPI0023EABF47|nr:bifunctional DNA primase/polymerase [Streptomyces sp. WMMB303]MDF4250471.1 DNA primase [Streptomyces sp. WMMB303]
MPQQPPSTLLAAALDLAAHGLPVLPLSRGKRPFGNCTACTGNACGGRPNMKHAGACHCPHVCHAWAAATTDPHVLTSRPWQAAWQRAAHLAYHPAGAGLTVVDLDNAEAVAWARATLPPTRNVDTSRGQHWIYRGVMSSANRVRPGVDLKSHAAYARWLGTGTGTPAPLPSVVRALVEEETTRPRARVVSSPGASGTWQRRPAHGCRHTEGYVRTGLERGLAKVRARTEQGAGSQAFGVAQFLATRHTACPGPCGLDTLAEQIVAAAVSVGVPEPYARRAVANGMTAGQGTA